ncbi:heavy metal-binding domain-containing protein [Butyrivibrio fibrisolvens]|uniref:heavy metal-binding domain-containing protein n=1 Tax=Butyrivibrio fibrisolvens TaxID=831 RepID=UPI0003B73FC9|nr:heavy metal-binding domain-containing protein [Butyrivibrio fibrisolvens]
MGAVVCCLCGTKQSVFKPSLTIKIGSKEFSLCDECSDLFEVIRDKHYRKDVSSQIVALKKRINENIDKDELLIKYVDIYLDSNGKTEEEINERINSVRQIQLEADEEAARKTEAEKRLLKEEEIRKKYEKDERFLSLKLTTGYNFEGYRITDYLGVNDSECLIGTGMFSEFSRGVSDFLGTESGMMKSKLSDAKKTALARLKEKAVGNGANAIIGINYDILTLQDHTIVVSVNGTFVKIEKTELR